MNNPYSKINRRNFLKSAMTTGLLLPVSSSLSSSLLARTTIAKRNPLAIPTLETGTRKANQVSFNLKINASKTAFFQGLNTPTLGINQSFLGPVLRAKHGDYVNINVSNQINQISTLHWHGMTLPANMDGGPHQEIKPGKTWNSRFQIRQGASTLWYHSHTMH